MIQIQDKFLSTEDINYILNYWGKYGIEFSPYAINFHFIDFIKNNIDTSPIKSGIFPNTKFEKIRLQKYDSSLTQVETYHGHSNLYNYIFFLNDNFQGGELEFEMGITIRPKKGSLVHFNNNELHRVLPCIGDRWTLVLSGNEYIDLKLEDRKKTVF